MSRITIPSRDEAPAASQEILDIIGKRVGFIPALHRLMALSPNVLSGLIGLQTSLGKTLDLKTRDGIALAVSKVNDCGYCLKAHAYVASALGKMPADEIELNKEAKSGDPKKAAAVLFASQVVDKRGHVTDEELDAVRAAGFTDAQVIEIVALSVQFLFTNFMNTVADTPHDFPPKAA